MRMGGIASHSSKNDLAGIAGQVWQILRLPNRPLAKSFLGKFSGQADIRENQVWRLQALPEAADTDAFHQVLPADDEHQENGKAL